jgi:hypothetical protein
MVPKYKLNKKSDFINLKAYMGGGRDFSPQPIPTHEWVLGELDQVLLTRAQTNDRTTSTSWPAMG